MYGSDGGQGPWNDWDNLVSDIEGKSQDRESVAMSATVWSSEGSGEYVPAMPCRAPTGEHRVKNVEIGRKILFNAAVARPVGRKEISEQPKAQEA